MVEFYQLERSMKLQSTFQIRFKDILLIILTLLLVTSVLVNCASYFNSKQIESISSQCYDKGGEVILEIHNLFTNDYSFMCR